MLESKLSVISNRSRKSGIEVVSNEKSKNRESSGEKINFELTSQKKNNNSEQ